MGTYVVGDIHGHFDELMSLKEKIENMDPEAVFILVGDVLDRGPKSLEMIRWAMEHISKDGKYRMVLGNHEDLKIEWWKKYKRNRCENEQYGFHKFLIKGEVSESEVEAMIEFFESLPIVIEMDVQTKEKEQHYIIAHAAMCSDFLTEDGHFIYEMLERESWLRDGEEIMWRAPRIHILWERNFWGNLWKQDTIFVHGHTPTCVNDLTIRGAVPGKIDFKKNDINVDCGVYLGDRHRNLAAIRLEDLEEIYLWEMDAALIANWNRKVSEKDHVYIIGDFCFRNEKPEEWYLEQLKGRKHLVIGNHDKKLLENAKAMAHFESVDKMMHVSDGGKEICSFEIVGEGIKCFCVYQSVCSLHNR